MGRHHGSAMCTTTNVKQMLPESAKFGPSSKPYSAKRGPQSAKLEPSSAHVGGKSTVFGHIWAAIGQSWPEFDGIRDGVGGHWLDFGLTVNHLRRPSSRALIMDHHTKSVDLGRSGAIRRFGRCRSKLANHRSTAKDVGRVLRIPGRCWPSSAQSWPMLALPIDHGLPPCAIIPDLPCARSTVMGDCIGPLP